MGDFGLWESAELSPRSDLAATWRWLQWNAESYHATPPNRVQYDPNSRGLFMSYL